MPRPPRLDHSDAWHHVMNRGIARQEIFFGDPDRRLFLDCVAQAAHESSVEVHAHCLMRNHFHLLLRSRDGLLSKFLRHLSGRYTRLMNKRHLRDGPLFRGRAVSVLIRSDAQLVQTSRYIHLNPISAGLCRNPEDWAWSSARCYLGLEPPAPWLYTDAILEMFATTAPGGDYRSFLNDGMDLATMEFYNRPCWAGGV